MKLSLIVVLFNLHLFQWFTFMRFLSVSNIFIYNSSNSHFSLSSYLLLSCHHSLPLLFQQHRLSSLTLSHFHPSLLPARLVLFRHLIRFSSTFPPSLLLSPLISPALLHSSSQLHIAVHHSFLAAFIIPPSTHTFQPARTLFQPQSNSCFPPFLFNTSNFHVRFFLRFDEFNFLRLFLDFLYLLK